jgi:hypothetical protein
LWTEKSKINIHFQLHAVCETSIQLKARLQIPPWAKHCRGNIMMRMHSVELILNLCISSMALWRRQYEGILDKNMLLHYRNQMLCSCIFQQNNDSKHILKPLQEWCVTNKLHILKWPSQYLGRYSEMYKTLQTIK